MNRTPTSTDLRPRAHRHPVPHRLVGIWAHPDDEAYLSAGLMARVIDAGGHVTVITATRGEAGTSDASLLRTPAFASHREAELRASLAQLGVSDVRFLDLPDGGCADVTEERAVRMVSDHLESLAPDTIVTFGPDGITGHPDHVAVSGWATAAGRRIDTPVLYAAMTDGHVATHAEMHDELGLFSEYGTGHAPSVPEALITLRCDLDAAELIRKRRALACHASQTEALAELIGEDRFTTWWRRETFRPAAEARAAATATLVGAR